jgi:hypothetical protein
MVVFRAMMTPDGTMLHSKHRHDFVGHEDKNGNFYAIDGGLQYCRITAMAPDYKIVEVHDTENWEIVRQFGYRIHKDGSICHIAKMSDSYLLASMSYAESAGQKNSLSLLKKELEFRQKWNINVNEQGELS